MSFLDRAKNLYSRGQAVRAAVLLAEGLKRNPAEAEALEWLLDLYVRELPASGIEAELIQILANQPNGRVLYEVVENALESSGAYDKLKALDDSRKRANVLHDDQDEAPVTPDRAAQPGPASLSPDTTPSVAEPEEPAEYADHDDIGPPPRRDDWDALDREAMASIRVAIEDDSAKVVPERDRDERSRESNEPAESSAPSSVAPPSGLSRILPPLDDVNDDLAGLGIGEDEPELDQSGMLRYRGTVAVAVAVIFLGVAFVVAFIHGSNVSGSDADAAGSDGSAMEEMK